MQCGVCDGRARDLDVHSRSPRAAVDDHDDEAAVDVLEGRRLGAGAGCGPEADGAWADEAAELGEGPEAFGDFVIGGGVVDFDELFVGAKGERLVEEYTRG